jgi:hypothetical protein
MATPVKARSEELKQLQQELLDKNVKAGVLEVEVAEKVAATREPAADYATEKDIREYQKNVRRAVRLLYKRGELPSSFVEELEQAADAEIISFSASKALRNDMRYHFRSLLRRTEGDAVLKALERRKLIPAARNHRLVMDWRGDGGAATKLAEFERLVDSEDDFELAGDSDVKIKQWQIPQRDTEYRLKMRRVCRALVKTGLVGEGALRHVEELIGVPIVGTLEAR